MKKTVPATKQVESSVASKFLQFFDEYALLICSAVLLIFVPLYPKLPLFDIIEGYLVRARIEDILIFITGIIWLIQLKRQKTSLHTPLTPPIVSYALAGFLTIVSAIFITQSIPLQTIHIGKSVLHYLRYLEYFSLFFILFSTIKTKKHVYVLLGIVFATLAAIIVYGYGQKYWYWPVYSTMNREFSKGIRLYLTEHARVQSTFGGHYDMAGYLVVVTPFVLSQLLTTTKKRLKFVLAALYFAATWLLVASGSRSSFVGFVFGNLLAIPLLALQQRTLLKGALFTLGNGTWVSLTIVIFMLIFGQDMYDRFLQTLAGRPALYTAYMSTLDTSKKFFSEDVPLALGIKEEQIAAVVENIPKAEVPTNGLSTDDAAALVASDERPVTTKPAAVDPTTQPPDVYVDVPDKQVVATVSASGETEYVTIEKPRVYSVNAQNLGLSEAIRLDALWPQAVRGFLSNPLFGSGYATLNKESVIHFTEAESTDNNFLRTLGETGILGFITFYGTILLAALASWKLVLQKKSPTFLHALNVSFIAGTGGLLVNALYIDIFAASKVAMTYWALVGLVLGANVVFAQSKNSTTTVTSAKENS